MGVHQIEETSEKITVYKKKCGRPALLPKTPEVFKILSEMPDDDLKKLLKGQKYELIDLISEGYSMKKAMEKMKITSKWLPTFKLDPAFCEGLKRAISKQSMYYLETIGNKQWRISRMGEVAEGVKNIVDGLLVALDREGANKISFKRVVALTHLVKEYRELMKDSAFELGQLEQDIEKLEQKTIVFVSNIQTAPKKTVIDLNAGEQEVKKLMDYQPPTENVTSTAEVEVAEVVTSMPDIQPDPQEIPTQEETQVAGVPEEVKVQAAQE